ncbi:MAG: glycosyltransferase family 39 protein [Flavobacteriales bacterium]|nr:glycosyltransferase family 39 protein [Flavobacteriales bacterium]
MRAPLQLSDRALIALLLLLNAGLKLCWLGVNELTIDEPFTVHWSQQSLSDLWAMFRTENNPPLYFLLIKAWSACVPFEPAWLRVPSAVFSALTVWPLYLLANRLSGRSVALTAALIFTFTNYHYGFAHEVRAYALFTLLATTGMWLLVRGKDKPNNGLRAMLGLSALNVVLVYTHFFGWLAIGLQFLCVLVLPDLRHLRRNFSIGLGMTAAWYLPYATIFLGRLGSSVAHGTWVEPPVPEELYNMLWRWSNAPVVVIAFLLLIMIGAWRSKLTGPGIRLASLWVVVPLLGMFAVSFQVPMFLDRYLVYVAPGFAMLVAVCIGSVSQDLRVSIGVSAMAIIGMVATFTPWKDNGRHPSQVVRQVHEWRSGAVILQPPWYDLTFLYASDPNECFTLPGAERSFCMGKGFLWTAEDAASLPIDPSAEEQVVLVDAGASLVDPSGSVKAALRAALPQVDSVEADHRVWVYRFRH